MSHELAQELMSCVDTLRAKVDAAMGRCVGVPPASAPVGAGNPATYARLAPPPIRRTAGVPTDED